MPRGGMEESYETFEEELWPPRADLPPQRPVRAIHRSEMYNSRTTKEVNPVPQQPSSEPKAFPRQPSVAKTTSLHKAFSIQNLTQIETPWENVTLNRCLFVAITILVLTSGFQRMHETFRGHGSEEEEEEDAALTMRRPGAMRRRGPPPEPETSIWEVMLSWLPDLDDDEEEEDDDDDKEMKRGKSKKGETTRAPSRVRNRPLPDKKLLKQSKVKLEDKRAGKAREEIKGKKKRVKKEDPEEEEERDEETVPKKPKSGEKEKKKTKKG
ncbi:uncharacterized protein ACNS7B_019827 isoform 1-T1 [Menidia menidia]